MSVPAAQQSRAPITGKQLLPRTSGPHKGESIYTGYTASVMLGIDYKKIPDYIRMGWLTDRRKEFGSDQYNFYASDLATFRMLREEASEHDKRAEEAENAQKETPPEAPQEASTSAPTPLPRAARFSVATQPVLDARWNNPSGPVYDIAEAQEYLDKHGIHLQPQTFRGYILKSQGGKLPDRRGEFNAVKFYQSDLHIFISAYNAPKAANTSSEEKGASSVSISPAISTPTQPSFATPAPLVPETPKPEAFPGVEPEGIEEAQISAGLMIHLFKDIKATKWQNLEEVEITIKVEPALQIPLVFQVLPQIRVWTVWIKTTSQTDWTPWQVVFNGNVYQSAMITTSKHEGHEAQAE